MYKSLVKKVKTIDDFTVRAHCSNDPKRDAVELDAGDDRLSEAVSMTSLRSRSKPRSRSRSRLQSNSRGRAMSRSGSRPNSWPHWKIITTDRLEAYMRDDLLHIAVPHAENGDSKKKDGTELPN